MFEMANRDCDDGTQENANKYGEAHHGRSLSSVGRIIVPTTGTDLRPRNLQRTAPHTVSVRELQILARARDALGFARCRITRYSAGLDER
jgi:hypothetical protein